MPQETGAGGLRVLGTATPWDSHPRDTFAASSVSVGWTPGRGRHREVRPHDEPGALNFNREDLRALQGLVEGRRLRERAEERLAERDLLARDADQATATDPS